LNCTSTLTNCLSMANIKASCDLSFSSIFELFGNDYASQYKNFGPQRISYQVTGVDILGPRSSNIYYSYKCNLTAYFWHGILGPIN
jgi:hypothetical protein